MFKKIKSLFLVEDSSDKHIGEKPAVQKESKSPKIEDQKIDISTGNVTKASLDRFLKVLADAMEGSNIPGYDYLEFKQATRSLDKLESDEAKRFVTAFTLAQTMGAEKESLMKSAEFYLEVLKKEEVKFEESLENQVKSKLNNKKQSLSNLKEKSVKKQEQIRQLQEEIKGIDGKMKEVESQIENSSKKLANVHKSFSSAYELITKQIRSDIDKIEKYLK